MKGIWLNWYDWSNVGRKRGAWLFVAPALGFVDKFSLPGFLAWLGRERPC